MAYWEVCCLVSKCLEIYLLPFCYWFLIWLHCGQKNILYKKIQFFYICWGCFMAQDTVHLCKCFMGTWKKNVCSVIGWSVPQISKNPASWWQCCILLHSCWFSMELFLQILSEGCWSLQLQLCISPFSSICVHFTYFAVLLFSAYTFVFLVDWSFILL